VSDPKPDSRRDPGRDPDSDIDRYPDASAPSEGPAGISGIREPISERGLPHGHDRGDSNGYQDRGEPPGGSREWISREDFFAEGPLYQDTDFESIEEYLIHREDEWRRRNGLKSLKAEPPRPSTLDQKGGRQVGLRLPGEDYERLAELSERNGVAPATMARILVVRALRADDALAEAGERLDG